MTRLKHVLMLCPFLWACTPPIDGVVLLPEPALGPVFESYVEHTDWDGLRLDEAPGRSDLTIEIRGDMDCSECFQLDGRGRTWTVRGGAPLGVQYGVTEVLERMGVRFLHPFSTYIPAELSEPPFGESELHSPDIERRGLHLHTLHPIEGMFDFWLPSSTGVSRASSVIDWVVKNRGNHIQWVGLDDIEESGLERTNWQAHTAAILDAAHLRGLTTGLGVQLFGSGNLQQAFDLLDEVGSEAQQREAMEERWGILTEGLDFDLFNLSFGEFFGEDPETFIESVNLSWEVLQELQPGTEMTTVIHVGEELRVEYEGQDLLYYFLAAYADPEVIPWVHTVMYFNLFESALGAYGHDEFGEHRNFLLERLDAGEPVGYFPETAYWVSFDISVPQQLPFYVRSRWLDLHELESRTGQLPRDHVLFSSGWEWGYWLHDRASLRMSYELPPNYESLIIDAWEPFGPDGPALGEELSRLVETQALYHLEKGLSAYLAGRDSGMEFGDETGIIAQPPRVSLASFASLPSEERDALVSSLVLEGTSSLTEALAQHLERVWELDIPTDDPFVAETLDGLALSVHRSAFVGALYQAVDHFADGGDFDPFLAEAQLQLDAAKGLVNQRHAALHYPDPALLRNSASLPTLYQYGYLQMADQLCFWERELAQALFVIEGGGTPIPGCLF